MLQREKRLEVQVCSSRRVAFLQLAQHLFLPVFPVLHHHMRHVTQKGIRHIMYTGHPHWTQCLALRRSTKPRKGEELCHAMKQLARRVMLPVLITSIECQEGIPPVSFA